MIGRMDYLHKHINSVKQYYGYGQNERPKVLVIFLKALRELRMFAKIFRVSWGQHMLSHVFLMRGGAQTYIGRRNLPCYPGK